MEVRLSEDVVEKFREMWYRGMSENRISKELGLSINEVYVCARLLGLKPRKEPPKNRRRLSDNDIITIRKLREEGKGTHEIARIVGVSPSTIQVYLKCMGLTNKRNVRRCPYIPKYEIEKLYKNHTDKEIADKFNTTVSCIYRLRRKYGISKKLLIRSEQRNKREIIITKIIVMLLKKGLVTSLDVRRELGIRLTPEIVRDIEAKYSTIKSFRIEYMSTTGHSLFPRSFYKLFVIYLEGREPDVITFILNNIPKGVPKRVIKYVLRMNSVPPEILETLDAFYKQNKVKTRK